MSNYFIGEVAKSFVSQAKMQGIIKCMPNLVVFTHPRGHGPQTETQDIVHHLDKSTLHRTFARRLNSLQAFK
jgi:hypothetical protein